jgi:hypothetical protein
MFRNDIYFVRPDKYRNVGLWALLASAVALVIAAQVYFSVEDEISDLRAQLAMLGPSESPLAEEQREAEKLVANARSALSYDWNAFAAAIESETLADWRVISVSYVRGARSAEIELETEASKFSGEGAISIPPNISVKSVRRVKESNAVRVVGTLEVGNL